MSEKKTRQSSKKESNRKKMETIVSNKSENHKEKIAKIERMDTLGIADLRKIVCKPEGEDMNEWYATKISQIYDELKLLYSTISEYCTAESCPDMKGGDMKYLWADNKKYKNPVEVPAPEYIGLLLTWVREQLEDETIFPSQIGNPFPDDFESRISKIMSRMFRMYVHFYYYHMDHFKILGIETHLNTSFKHFIFFSKTYNLISDDQLEPLKDLIEKFMF